MELTDEPMQKINAPWEMAHLNY